MHSNKAWVQKSLQNKTVDKNKRGQNKRDQSRFILSLIQLKVS